MMSNVIAFPTPKKPEARACDGSTAPVTLFIHIKRATLIAHLTGRIPQAPAKDGRLSKS